MTKEWLEEKKFIRSYARQRLTTSDGILWEYFDCGNKSKIPLVCIPGTCGTASVFHYQVEELTSKGYRVITLKLPEVWTHQQWNHSFDRFLDVLRISEVHIYGVSLGAYLAQRYASCYPKRVKSLVMTHGFCDTAVFGANAPCIKMFSYLPEFYLKKYILDKFPSINCKHSEIVDAIQYMAMQLDSLSQKELASRLTLNCLSSSPNLWKVMLDDSKITLIDSYQFNSLPIELRDQMYQRFPGARKALIKNGGDFPYISHHEEVSMYLQVHLRTNGLA